MKKPINDQLKFFTGNSNPELAKKVCAYLGIPIGAIQVRRFSDGEIFVEIGENVRGKDVFVMQSTCSPVNDNLMELLIIMDALRRASARRITAVMPYYGYARQDRKVAPRVPISAKLVADLITAAGARRVLTMDLHAGQIQGFFNIPVDNLFAAPVLLEYIKKHYKNHLVMVSPDVGGVERARAFAKRLSAQIAIIDKRRDRPNSSEVMNIVGQVKGWNSVLLDDMVDTAGTLVKAAQALGEQGAKSIRACATHAVLSGPALDRINDSLLRELVVTDTIPLGEKARQCPKIKVLSVAGLLGEAIKRIHMEDSVSSLFI
ncbi:MAG: ribose-phosphate pyrophosphokinase [Desulfobacterota bacterium]|jgi:ribose-phosphate pyrophosphokinase|nr:ribose-phosphate pyrophosphokinase [Thermodesulfobacteriota bacterium]